MTSGDVTPLGFFLQATPPRWFLQFLAGTGTPEGRVVLEIQYEMIQDREKRKKSKELYKKEHIMFQFIQSWPINDRDSHNAQNLMIPRNKNS